MHRVILKTATTSSCSCSTNMLTSIGSRPARSCAHGYSHQLVGPRTRWMVSRRGQHLACRAAAERQPLSAEETLLDAFWHVRKLCFQTETVALTCLIAFAGQSPPVAKPAIEGKSAALAPHCGSTVPHITAATRLQARGVWDQEQRAKLIACLGRSASSGQHMHADLLDVHRRA